MTPATSVNLDRFLDKYRKDQAYFLAPGYVQSGDKLDFDPDLVIACSQLHVRPAWEIAEHDPDIIGLHADDDVIIPEGVDEAPVRRTLERIKKRRAQTKPSELSAPHVTPKKVGRNEACPCGSGKKFKKCHGQ
jgi:SEC-C motif-containing protein